MKLPSLIGKSGEFTAYGGEVFQCIVTAHDDPPWDDDCLVITYVRDGFKIEGAMIPRKEFRGDDL